ncbi:MAG TPA: MraZ family transcriptional regulator [Alphaproteobacteria bacterium]|nr:MraZ family transcriptional regulator [Alphaproteobacteria bacterium]
MPLFLSTAINKVDKKGRVSVPAAFRAALGEAEDIVVFRALYHNALEACSLKHLEILSNSLERLNLAPEIYELIETTIFGGAHQLPIDGDGRIVLPANLITAAGIEEEAAFVGRRRTFQIWNPQTHAAFDAKSREAARAHNISLSKIIADASAFMQDEAA